MMQEASEPQLFRKWTKEPRVKIERVDKVTLNGLLMDHYHKVRDNHD